MNTYELMLVINPQVSDTEAGEIVEKAKQILVNEKAEILNEDRLGRKRFAHPMGKNRDGFYVYMKVKAEPQSVTTINHNLKLQESILRSLLVTAAPIETVKKA